MVTTYAIFQKERADLITLKKPVYSSALVDIYMIEHPSQAIINRKGGHR